ncbi:VTT domain-containing protein [Myxococcota bacterium]|nr:VTT domain-containing protein [Myxococcota bacterium]
MPEPRTFARAVVDLGAWGYLAFLVACTLLRPFGVPGTVFVVAAPLLWPWPVAFALSMIGTMAASVVGFSFARFLARDWVKARIPARFHRYDEALARHALRTVFVLRLIFWMPQALHGFLGVSKGSLLGYIPPLLLVSVFAAEVFDPSGALQPRAFSLLGTLLAGSVVLAWWLRRDALRSR